MPYLKPLIEKDFLEVNCLIVKREEQKPTMMDVNKN